MIYVPVYNTEHSRALLVAWQLCCQAASIKAHGHRNQTFNCVLYYRYAYLQRSTLIFEVPRIVNPEMSNSAVE